MGGPTARGPLNSLPPQAKMATPDLHGGFNDVSSGLRTAHTQLPTLPRPDPMQIQTGDRVVVEVLQLETMPFWSNFRPGAAEQLRTILLFRLSTPPRPPLPYHPRPHRHSPPHTMNTQVGTPVCTSITTTTAHRLGTTHFVTFPNVVLVMLAHTRHSRGTRTRTTRPYTYTTHHHQPLS